MILVDTTYINDGGGRTLLAYLMDQIEQLSEDEQKYFFLILDDRVVDLYPNTIKTNHVFIKNKEQCRKVIYKKYQHEIAAIFCFANVPPPIKFYDKKVYIYFHNRLLLTGLFTKIGFSIPQKILYIIKRTYTLYVNRPSYTWIVQTETIKAELERILQKDNKVLIIPFFPPPLFKPTVVKKPHFVYVASGFPHKNHRFLFEVWKMLGNQYNYYPTLYVTFDGAIFKTLQQQVNDLRKENINIINMGIAPADIVSEKYNECEYLIFPSLVESFGLPLIEAIQYGCKVIASNLSYVTNIVQPSRTFDPFNPKELLHIMLDIRDNKPLPPSTCVVKDEIQSLMRILKQSIPHDAQNSPRSQAIPSI